MPNYRLTHKMTGVTVPATAGYYGQHDQTENLYKLAGSEIYLWKSTVTANKFYIGATAFGDATAKFSATTINGTWAGINSGTGTPVYSEYTLGESWSAAEKIVFDSLKAFVGCTEDINCFRGYLPVNSDGKPKFSNVWMMTSGGTSRSFPIERTYGASGAWCNMLKPVDIMGLFENRETAMHFSGAVEAWLKETNNVHQVGNVTWCHFVGLAEPPEELIIEGKRYWRIKIPLEMLYLTEGVYSA